MNKIKFEEISYGNIVGIEVHVNSLIPKTEFTNFVSKGIIIKKNDVFEFYYIENSTLKHISASSIFIDSTSSPILTDVYLIGQIKRRFNDQIKYETNDQFIQEMSTECKIDNDRNRTVLTASVSTVVVIAGGYGIVLLGKTIKNWFTNRGLFRRIKDAI
jgi:hypothetical protein